MGEKVFVYDTTLRDGEQGAYISYSLIDKINIAKRLDEFGVHYIEGGWPDPSNVKSVEFFRAVRDMEFKNARVAAFGSTRMAGKKPEEDTTLNALLDAETPVVTIFGKAWDLHVTGVLGTTLEENLAMIEDSVAFLKSRGREVVFDAEHFFDGFARNPEYALQAVQAAARGGADWIALADTNGGSLPSHIFRGVKAVRDVCDVPLGIHAHNDMELAVANSLAAVQAGCRQVQGTVNGFGERCGNANLISIIPSLELKMGFDTIGEESLKDLKQLSHYVYEIASITPSHSQPYVGSSAFAHKAGVHANAILKEPVSYEHMEPGLVGNKRHIMVSEQAGSSSLFAKAKEMGIELDRKSPRTRELISEIKALENEGYEFDGADASLKLFLLRRLGLHRPFFILDGTRLMIEKNDQSISVDSMIKIRVGDIVEHTAVEGNGPVNALDRALRKALLKFYPEIEEMHLADYKVRVIEGTHGTSARVKVFINSADASENWNTIGVSENIIEASWDALVDSIEYKLLKERGSAEEKKLIGEAP